VINFQSSSVVLRVSSQSQRNKRLCNKHRFFIRPPGTVVPEGLMFYNIRFIYLFIYLFRCRISELCWPIPVKLCHVITIWVRFIMQVHKFGGCPLKNWGQNMQNLRRFYTTFEFDREYRERAAFYMECCG